MIIENKNENINLKVLQINIRGIKKNFFELCRIVDRYNIDIILIQESQLKDNDNPPPIINFSQIGKNRLNKIGGGVGIYVRNNYKISRLDVDCTGNIIEIVGLRLYTKYKRPIDIYTIYVPPNSKAEVY